MGRGCLGWKLHRQQRKRWRPFGSGKSIMMRGMPGEPHYTSDGDAPASTHTLAHCTTHSSCLHTQTHNHGAHSSAR